MEIKTEEKEYEERKWKETERDTDNRKQETTERKREPQTSECTFNTAKKYKKNNKYHKLN